MTKLKGLLLTEGMHGMISQVEGLAKALNLEFIHEKIELNNFWKMIPPKITPVKDFVFKNNISEKFNVVISCGRKSVVPSIFLKKKFGSKIMNIHIQDPKVTLNNFDFVIAPEHDGLEGTNVIKTKGAIHYLTKKELDENWSVLAEAIQTILRKSGDVNAYDKIKKLTRGKPLTKKLYLQIVNDLKASKEDKDMLLKLTPHTYLGEIDKILENL